MNELKPVATDLDALSVFPFLSDSFDNLKIELLSYLAKAMGVSPEVDTLEWWKRNSDALPSWSSAARKVLVVQPPSAAAKRMFSILANSFGDKQENSLEDYVEASVMLQYNHD